jgi:hypothetical protein
VLVIYGGLIVRSYFFGFVAAPGLAVSAQVEAPTSPEKDIRYEHAEALAGGPVEPGPSAIFSLPKNLKLLWSCRASTPGKGPSVPAGRKSHACVRGP